MLVLFVCRFKMFRFIVFEKMIKIIFLKVIDLDILNLYINEVNMYIYIFVCVYYFFCFRLYKGFGINS